MNRHLLKALVRSKSPFQIDDMFLMKVFIKVLNTLYVKLVLTVFCRFA